jgi:hypothetical protein
MIEEFMEICLKTFRPAEGRYDRLTRELVGIQGIQLRADILSAWTNDKKEFQIFIANIIELQT